MNKSQDIFDENEILVEIAEIYDGWIARYNTETKEIFIRDFYVTSNWDSKKKEEVKDLIKKSFDEYKER